MPMRKQIQIGATIDSTTKAPPKQEQPVLNQSFAFQTGRYTTKQDFAKRTHHSLKTKDLCFPQPMPRPNHGLVRAI